MNALRLVPLALLLALSSAAPALPEDPSLPVGVILPLSGEFAVLGQACRKGIEFALSESPPGALKVIFADSPGASAKVSLSAYQKLKTFDHVELFLGFLSPEELGAVAPLSDKENTALIAFNTAKKRPTNTLLIWMSPNIEAERLAAHVVKNYRNVAILSGDQAWEGTFSEQFTASFAALGGKVVLRIDSPYASKDVTGQVLRLRHSQAEAVIIPPYSLFSAYAKALRKLEIKLPIYGVELDQNAIDDAQGAAEGAQVIGPIDAADAFKKKFMAYSRGKNPDIPASQCYDALQIVLEARKQGIRSGAEFAKYFRELKSYAGVSGPIEFRGDDTIFESAILTVRNGLLSDTPQKALPQQ